MHDMTFQQLSLALPTSRIALPVSYVFNIYIYMDGSLCIIIYIYYVISNDMYNQIQNFKAL